VPQFFPEF